VKLCRVHGHYVGNINTFNHGCLCKWELQENPYFFQLSTLFLTSKLKQIFRLHCIYIIATNNHSTKAIDPKWPWKIIPQHNSDYLRFFIDFFGKEIGRNIVWYVPTKANGYVARNGTNIDGVMFSMRSHFCSRLQGAHSLGNHWPLSECNSVSTLRFVNM
jgi:hypothetical protein